MSKKVFIVGSPRSGTTILGRIFDVHPEIAQWYEPWFVWDYYFRNAKNDLRTAADATSEVSTYVKNHFQRYADALGCKVLVDKSPQNSFKIPFIRTIFPDAQFVHIVRDGRDATLSIKKEWDKRRMIVTSMKTPKGAWKALGALARNLARQPLLRDKIRALQFELGKRPWNRAEHRLNLRWQGQFGWGPLFPGWEEFKMEHSELAFNGMQWAQCVEHVLAVWDDIPEANKTTIRYEQMLDAPRQELERCLRFMGVAVPMNFFNNIPKLFDGNYNKWKTEFSQDQLAQIRPHISNALQLLEYETNSVW